jgi:hypothetical protein
MLDKDPLQINFSQVTAWDSPMDRGRFEFQNGNFDYSLIFRYDNSAAATKGIIIMRCTPLTYGSLIALRCARQSPTTSLTGIPTEPLVGSFDRESDFGMKGSKYPKIAMTGNKSEILEQALQAGDVCVSQSEPGQKFCHPGLKDFFEGKVTQDLEITECDYYPERWLKARADFDDEDRDADGAAREYDLAYEEDLQRVSEEYLEDLRRES